MTDGKNNDLMAIEVIQRDVASLTELDDQFAKLRKHVLHGTPYLGMRRKHLDVVPDCLDRTKSRISALWGKKIIEAD